MPSGSVRRQLAPTTGPSALKAFQNAVFAAWSSSAASMSGVTSASIVGVKRRTTPGSASASGSASGNCERVEELHGLLAHHDESFGCTMWSSRVSHGAACSSSSVPNLRQFVP